MALWDQKESDSDPEPEEVMLLNQHVLAYTCYSNTTNGHNSELILSSVLQTQQRGPCTDLGWE